MASVQRSDLRARAKSLADAVNDSFAADSEWNTWVNDGANELHGLLARSCEDYVESTSSFTTDGTSESIALPSDFFKASGVDMKFDGCWVSLRRFDWDERNALRNATVGVGVCPRYLVRGSKLWLLPVPAAGIAGTLNYLPSRTPFEEDDDTFDGVNGWEQYICVFAAIQALRKGEEDTGPLERELARLEVRIVREAKTRDRGNAPRVRDVERDYDYPHFGTW